MLEKYKVTQLMYQAKYLLWMVVRKVNVQSSWAAFYSNADLVDYDEGREFDWSEVDGEPSKFHYLQKHYIIKSKSLTSFFYISQYNRIQIVFKNVIIVK